MHRKEETEMDRLSEDDFLFIWEPVLGPETTWDEYCKYSLDCDLDEIDLDEED
jgi:hypothetical protein